MIVGNENNLARKRKIRREGILFQFRIDCYCCSIDVNTTRWTKLGVVLVNLPPHREDIRINAILVKFTHPPKM